MTRNDSQDLRRKGVNAFAWDVSGKLLKQGVTFFVTIVLARILGPEEFGFVAMSMFFVSVSTILIDLGLSASLVQAKSVTEEEYSTVFFVNVTAGMLISLLLFFGSDWVAHFYEEVQIADVMRVLAINPMIGSLSVVHLAILTREMRFRVQTYASFVASIISGVVAIVLAYSGYGVWSLVLQTLIGLSVQTVIIWSMERWRPRLQFNSSVLRTHLPFSGRMFLSGIINTVYERVDLLLIGKLFSAADLGLYYRATSFNTLIIRYAGTSLVRVFFPLISRMQEDLDEVKRVVENSLHGLSLVLFLLSGMVFVSAHEIVVLLFSDRWLPSVPYLRLVMLYAYAYPVSAVLVNVLSGTGHAKSFLRLEIYKKIILTICMPIGLYFGIDGFLAAMCVAYVGSVWLNVWMIGGVLRMPLFPMMKSIYQYAILVSVAVAASVLVGSLLPQSDVVWELMLNASVKTIIMIIVYAFMNRAFKTIGYEIINRHVMAQMEKL